MVRQALSMEIYKFRTRLRFRDNCLARVTAGVALGGASGGAVLYMEILSCNWMYLKYSLEFEYICNAGIRQGAGKQGLLQALPSQVQEKESRGEDPLSSKVSSR
ncbi:hypothetical protein ACFE04_008547 [Oxalis oulophora]